MKKVNEYKGHLVCVPHVPLTKIQENWDVPANIDFWNEYKARIAEFKEFDPDLVIIFGGNHMDGIHLKLMPQLAIAHVAEALNDCGGWPGKLDVPMEITTKLHKFLTDEGFDLAESYAMEVDHGFSNPLHYFLGSLDAKPVIPIHINTMMDPRPTMKRCRQLGEAIGRFAKKLNKRVAFIGAGGLSHQTNFIFPQYDNAPSEEVRNYLVYGGDKGGITREVWRQKIIDGMDKLSADLVSGDFVADSINPQWDHDFLETLIHGNLNKFDEWSDESILDAAGYGGSEVRLWLAAAAAAKAFSSDIQFIPDFYSGETTFAVGAGIVHSNFDNSLN